MKKSISPMWAGLIIALLISAFSLYAYFSFLSKESGYVLDNPTDELLYVKVDDTEYTLAPQQTVALDIDKGKHVISAYLEGKSDTLLNEKMITLYHTRGVINPTQSVYCIFGLPYGVQVNVDSIFQAKKTKLDQHTFYGDLQLDSAVIIESFYYGLNESFPTLVKRAEHDTLKLRKKIFRKNDFKQFYFERFE